MQDDETLWVAKADDVEPSAVYILESAVEKRERALIESIEAALENGQTVRQMRAVVKKPCPDCAPR
jgi:hypothetical protein